MAKYVLLLRDEYFPRTPKIHLSGSAGVEILEPNSVSTLAVAQGSASSGPFNWYWAVVDYDQVKELTTDTFLYVFPLIGDGSGPVEAVPFRRLRTPPKWVTPYSLNDLYNSSGFGPVEVLSDESAAVSAGYSSPTASPCYSLYLNLRNDGRHPGWAKGTKLGSYPELGVGTETTQRTFRVFTGKQLSDTYAHDTSSWPETINGANQMPWLTIILALLSFFASKKSGASNTKAAITAGLVGAGTYYVTHETDWGRVNLGDLDGVVTDGDGNVVDAGGTPVTGADGKPIVTGGNAGGTSFADIIRGWGATGTAAVIGAGAAATGSGIFSSKNLPWLLGGAALLLIVLKD